MLKTIIPELTEPDIYNERIDYIFRHKKEVSIFRQVSPLSENSRIFSGRYQDGKSPLVEMELIVIRFPKTMKPDKPNELYRELQKTFHFQ